MSFLFMGPALAALSDGAFIRRAVGLAVRIIAVILAIGSLLELPSAGGLMSDPEASGVLRFGLGVFSVLMLVRAYMLVHVCWIRAAHVEACKEGGFTVIPIAAVCARLVGEIAAVTVLCTGVAVGLVIFFAAGSVAMRIPPNGLATISGSPLVAAVLNGQGAVTATTGLLVILASALSAFIALLMAYFVAECASVGMDIAANVRAVRVRLEAGSTAQGVPTAGGVGEPEGGDAPLA